MTRNRTDPANMYKRDAIIKFKFTLPEYSGQKIQVTTSVFYGAALHLSPDAIPCDNDDME